MKGLASYLLFVTPILLLMACGPVDREETAAVPEVQAAEVEKDIEQQAAIEVEAEVEEDSNQQAVIEVKTEVKEVTNQQEALEMEKERAVVSSVPPESCPITRPPKERFTPPEPHTPLGPHPSTFWYGSEALWTAVPVDGVWAALPHNPDGYTQKIFWWHEGYVWTEEPDPQLEVTGRRLDETATPLIASKATNAFAPDIQSAMLVGVDFPTLGCWEITGRYRKEELSFVVWVAP